MHKTLHNLRLTPFCSLLLSIMLLAGVSPARSDQTPAPNPTLSPQEVVQIIVGALKSNDPSSGDSGIATVYRFASPANKQMTGPLRRFKTMIKRGFADMLNHVQSEYSEMQIENGTGLQAVWLTDRLGYKRGYVFQMGKQVSGEFSGQWMTESVWPIGVEKPKGQSI